MLDLKWYVASNLQDYNEESDLLYEGLYGYLYFQVNNHEIGLFFPERAFIQKIEEGVAEDSGTTDIFAFFHYLKEKTLAQNFDNRPADFYFWDDLIKLRFLAKGDYIYITNFSVDIRRNTERLLWEERILLSEWVKSISTAIGEFANNIISENPNLAKNKSLAELLCNLSP